jgi:hypothetical protein
MLELVGVAPFVYRGVNPISGENGSTFEFKVKYIDIDGDMPKDGNPKLILNPDSTGKAKADSTVKDMTEEDALDADVTDGKIYMVSITLMDGDYTYAFEVTNALNQTANMGPLDGPIVLKKEEEPDVTQETRQGDFFWISILVIAIIVGLVIGIVAGRSRRKEPPPEEIESTEPTYREAMPLAEAEAEDLEEPPPEEDIPPEEPTPEEDIPPEEEGSPEDAPPEVEPPAEEKPPEDTPPEEETPAEKPKEGGDADA